MPFYRSKIILDRQNCFVLLQIVLVESKSFWLGPNRLVRSERTEILAGQVHIRFFIIWTCSKWFWPDQNDLDGPKSVWTHKRTRHKCTYVNLINSTNTSLSEYLIELCDVQDHQYFLSYRVRSSRWLRRLHKTSFCKCTKFGPKIQIY